MRRFERPSGTSLMLSAPPTSATSCCPAQISSAAHVSAWSEVAQARETLYASMSFGSPARSTTSRAMLSQSSVGTTCPYTHSVTFGESSARHQPLDHDRGEVDGAQCSERGALLGERGAHRRPRS